MFASPQSMYKFHSLAQNIPTQSTNAGGSWSLISVRTNIRNHFPKPREVKRVLNHGYAKRMSTRGGRLIIMRRILQGKFILSH